MTQVTVVWVGRDRSPDVAPFLENATRALYSSQGVYGIDLVQKSEVPPWEPATDVFAAARREGAVLIFLVGLTDYALRRFGRAQDATSVPTFVVKRDRRRLCAERLENYLHRVGDKDRHSPSAQS